MKQLIALCVLFCVGSASAADWKVAKQKRGITIETRTVEGTGLKEFRGHMNVKARLNSLVALLYDIDNAPKWMHDNEELSLDHEISVSDRWLYLVNGAPWPLQTRDGYVHVEVIQDAETKAVSLAISADPERKPKAKKLTRIQSMAGGWLFIPKADKSVDVHYGLFVDPGGKVPKALVNMVVIDNPFGTLTGMQRMLASGKYDNAEMGWISEP